MAEIVAVIASTQRSHSPRLSAADDTAATTRQHRGHFSPRAGAASIVHCRPEPSPGAWVSAPSALVAPGPSLTLDTMNNIGSVSA